MQSSIPDTWDEVMVVAYKNRWQFFRMALFTPSYWPLVWVSCFHSVCSAVSWKIVILLADDAAARTHQRTEMLQRRHP